MSKNMELLNYLNFDDATHTYYLNGSKVLSITQLMNVKFKKKYDGIDSEILAKAAERGTRIHNAIENYEKQGIEENLLELESWKSMKERYGFECEDNELVILLEYKGNYYAGRLDLVLNQYDELGLADIKTTCKLDLNYLRYQLNLYRLGYIQTYGRDVTFLKGVWLRNEKSRFVNIPIDEQCAYELLEDDYQFKEALKNMF